MNLRPPSFFKSMALLFAGLFATFLLVEISIRVAGRLYLGHSSDAMGNKDDQFRILFLGNSHTYGYGIDPTKAYAHVLDDFFHQEVPGYKVSVFKEAIIAGTTRNLIERFDQMKSRIHPNLVMVMGGEPNIWNKYGYSEYISRRRSGQKTWSSLRELLSRSRFIRWLYSLSDLPVRSKLSPDQENEMAFYLLVAEFDSLFDPPIVFDDVAHLRSVITEFLRRHKRESGLSFMKARLFLGYLDVKHLKEFEAGFDLLEDIVHENNETLKDSVAKLVHDIASEEVPAAFREKLAALKRATPLDLKKRKPGLPADHTAMMDLARKYPDNNFLILDVGNKFIGENRILDAVKVFGFHLEENPMQIHGSFIYSFLERIATSSSVPEATTLARAIKKRFVERFPSEVHRFTREGDLDLANWVASDLLTLARNIRAEGADVVLQSYHYHLKPPVNQNVIQVHSGIMKASRESKAFFLDTGKDFIREYNARGRDYDRYFADPVHHPSVEGHRLVARIIYDYLNSNELIPPELRNLDSKKIYKFSWE